MQGKSIAAKTALTALVIAVAIWTTLGSPPHHPVSAKRQLPVSDGRPAVRQIDPTGDSILFFRNDVKPKNQQE
jgi:hypothetical protein